MRLMVSTWGQNCIIWNVTERIWAQLPGRRSFKFWSWRNVCESRGQQMYSLLNTQMRFVSLRRHSWKHGNVFYCEGHGHYFTVKTKCRRSWGARCLRLSATNKQCTHTHSVSAVRVFLLTQYAGVGEPPSFAVGGVGWMAVGLTSVVCTCCKTKGKKN